MTNFYAKDKFKCYLNVLLVEVGSRCFRHSLLMSL